MNKILLVILIIIILALAGVVVWQNWLKPAPVVNNQQNQNSANNSLQTIAMQLLDNELKSDLTTTDSGRKLLDYKINKVAVGTDENVCFRFGADFEVKPANKNGWMVSGNIGTDGWIRNISLGYDAIRQGDKYVLGQGFTGAASASCKDSIAQNCVGEGGYITYQTANKQPEDINKSECCAGLSRIFNQYWRVDSTTPGEWRGDAATGLATDVCVYCGNGVCGLGENKCNCPGDCK